MQPARRVTRPFGPGRGKEVVPEAPPAMLVCAFRERRNCFPCNYVM